MSCPHGHPRCPCTPDLPREPPRPPHLAEPRDVPHPANADTYPPHEVVVPEGTFARMMTDPTAAAPGLRAAVTASRKETR